MREDECTVPAKEERLYRNSEFRVFQPPGPGASNGEAKPMAEGWDVSGMHTKSIAEKAIVGMIG